MHNGRKLALVLSLLLALFVVGVTGYMFFLHVGFIDALYMTVITISTVGFSEVAKMTDAAKLFSIVIIFAGLSIVGYSFTSLVTFIFEGNIKNAWRRRRMSAKISALNSHYIVCGAGDVGHTVIEYFKDSGVDFIVIEKDADRHDELVEESVLTILGDATHEETLHKAGIMQAKGMVCTLSSDTDNVFTVLTARGLNEQIYIVARAVERTAHNKLIKAGANKTISPNEIGGQRIAAAMIRPSVTSFLDVMTRTGDVMLDIEEVIITPQSSIAGKNLSEAKIPEQTGLIVLALKKKDESNVKINPRANEVLGAGDSIIVIGTSDQVDRLEAIVSA
ncbi:potassium channel protein [Oscillospiraceae bacterium CM]|nr:potassium channel protein [Oscillospiraceae bacterium CM]